MPLSAPPEEILKLYLFDPAEEEFRLLNPNETIVIEGDYYTGEEAPDKPNIGDVWYNCQESFVRRYQTSPTGTKVWRKDFITPRVVGDVHGDGESVGIIHKKGEDIEEFIKPADDDEDGNEIKKPIKIVKPDDDDEENDEVDWEKFLSKVEEEVEAHEEIRGKTKNRG